MSRAKLILFLLSLSALGFASAGDRLEVVRIGLAHDSIYAVERSQNTIWAVGGHGLVIRSTDNGTQWEPIASPGDFAALDISIDGGKPVLVGQSGKAFEADVAKGSWTQLKQGPTSAFKRGKPFRWRHISVVRSAQLFVDPLTARVACHCQLGEAKMDLNRTYDVLQTRQAAF